MVKMQRSMKKMSAYIVVYFELSWIFSEKKCVPLTDTPDIILSVPKMIPDYYFGAVQLIQCTEGKWFKRDELERSVTCKETKLWEPAVDNTTCIRTYVFKCLIGMAISLFVMYMKMFF